MKDQIKTRKQLLRELEELREQAGRLQSDSERMKLELSALLAASRSVSRLGEFREAARSIYDVARELIGASGGYVALLSEDLTDNELLFLDPGGQPCTADPSLPMPVRGLREEVYRTGRVVYENGFASSEWARLLPEGHVTLDNVMFAPLKIEDRVVGLMGLANKEGGFTDNDARLATVFGDLAAVALSNDYTFAQLKRSEERFRSLTRSATDAIVSADSSGRIIAWNRGAERIFGYDEEEALGRELTMIIPSSLRDIHTGGIKRFLGTGEAKIIGDTVELEGVRKDGTTFPLELSLSNWEERGEMFFTGIIRDITRRKEAADLSEVLNGINAAINLSLEVEDILRTATVEAMKALGADKAGASLVDGGRWTVRYQLGFPEELLGRELDESETAIIETAAASGAPQPYDIERDEDTRGVFDRYGVKSALVVPLMIGGELMGALFFSRHERLSRFNDTQTDFAKKLSISVSLALRNATLYQNEIDNRGICQSYANQLGILHRIGLTLNREMDRDRLLGTVLRSAAELTSAGIGVMTLIREGETKIISSYYAPWSTDECTIGEEIPGLHRRITRLTGGQDRDAIRINDPGAFDFPEGHMRLRCLLIGTLRDTKGRVRGHFMLGNKAGDGDFTVEDEEVISLLAAQSSVALTSAENLEREHSVAEIIQEALIPDIPERDDIEVGILYRSAGPYGKIGGDFYDFMELDERRVAIAVGDVCGKGLSAATYTAMVKYMLRAYLGESLSPGECLTRLNEAVRKEISIDKFVTLNVSIVDTGSATVTYAAAGHPPAISCIGGIAAPVDQPPMVPLGVVDHQEYASQQFALGEGGALILYTDGLTDARPEGGVPLGEKRLVESVSEHCGLPAQQLADALVIRAVDYSGGRLRDDIAVLTVNLIRPPSPS